MENYEDEEYSQSKVSIKVWKKIIKLVFESKKHVIFMIVSVLGLATLDILYPLLNAYALKNFFEIPDPSKIQNAEIIKFALMFLGIVVGYAVIIFTFIRLASKVEAEVSYKLRKEAFEKLQLLSFGYYDKTPTGWIMARLTSDSRRLSSIISWGLVDLLWSLLTMTAIIIILYVIRPQLALIITVLVPILLIISFFLQKKILNSYRSVRKYNSNITAKYNEGILGTKTTKTLVIEEKNNNEFKIECDKFRKKSLKAVLLTSLFWPLILFTGYVGVALTLRVGTELIIVDKVIDVAVLYLFINYTTQFFDPVIVVARVFGDLQQAQASAERIISLIETKPEIVDSNEVIKKYGTILNPKINNYEPLKGDVEFKNVSFEYLKDESILTNFNLKVKRGMSVALVGATGSGKSTIVNLLCRFYEPSSGEILIDGVNYKQRSIGWLHSNLGYVLQSPHLFKGTIMENIKYGRKNSTDEEAINAAKLVDADAFINELDDKYNTNVGEGGSRLSQGQKQLISFARAILANPSILILDEATSSIDTNTELNIQKAINKLLSGRTSFIVAHRLSTIINADIILVIDNGKIIEKGTHKELLSLKKEYYNLYKNQFINQKIEQSKI